MRKNRKPAVYEGYKKSAYKRTKPNLQSLYFVPKIYDGFCRLADELVLPLDEHGRLKEKARQRRLTVLMLELYKAKVYGRHEFVGDNGKPISCGVCNHGKRIKVAWADVRKDSRNVNLSPEIRRDLKAFVNTRGSFTPRFDQPGASGNTLFQAAALTYAAEIGGRPTTFCDVCLMPVGGIQYLYGDTRFDADAYEITPSPTALVVYVKHKPPKSEKFEIFSIRANATPIASERGGAKIKELLSKIGKMNKEKLKTDLLKFGYELHPDIPIMEEGLVRLKTNQYIAVCTNPRPELI